MTTIRSLVDGFVWEHLERFITLVDEGGENTVFDGVRVLDEPEKFVHGALVNATAHLYVHYVKTGDSRCEITLERLKKFFSFVLNTDIKTWGKLSCLRGVFALHSAGLLNKIETATVEILKIKTDYKDFYDTDKNEIISLPSNYYRVAMACAGYREKLGWDSDNFSVKIAQKLTDIISRGAVNGWMDEEPPYGRFDRYSLILSSEFADTVMDLGLEMPEFLKNNLKNAAEISLFMANNRGDGVNYGRSLSCHGDATPLEIIASALAMGILGDDKKDLALAYSAKIIEKIFSFWYDAKKGSFDIWCGGRSTNKYRQHHRVLEVNLDMAMHLIATLTNFERAGVADTQINASVLKSSNTREVLRVDFTESKNRALFIIKHKDTMCMLPLIGPGSVCDWAAYMPYPSICGFIEGAPQAHMPFLVPEYMLEGKTARPIQFYDKFIASEKEDELTVTAFGNLAFFENNTPTSSIFSFKSVYTFTDDYVDVRFSTNAPYDSASMISGVHNENDVLSVYGFDSSCYVPTDGEYDFMTPSGAIVKASKYYTENKNDLGYRFLFR